MGNNNVIDNEDGESQELAEGQDMEMEMDSSDEDNQSDIQFHNEHEHEHEAKYEYNHNDNVENDDDTSSSDEDEDEYETDADDEETEESVEEEEEERISELEEDLNHNIEQHYKSQPVIIENIAKPNIKIPFGNIYEKIHFNSTVDGARAMMSDLWSFLKEESSRLGMSIKGALCFAFWFMLMLFLTAVSPQIAKVLHYSPPDGCCTGYDVQKAYGPLDDKFRFNVPKLMTEPLRADFVRIMNDNGDYLTLNPENVNEVTFTDDPSDEMAIWNVEIYPDKDGIAIKLKNKETEKYLRIHYSPKYNQRGVVIQQTKIVDVGGNGGKWTVFRVHKLKQIGHGCYGHHKHRKHNTNCGGNGSHREEYEFFLESDNIPRAYLGYGLSTIWQWFAYDVTQNIFASKRRSKWKIKYINNKDDVVQDIVVKSFETYIIYLNTSFSIKSMIIRVVNSKVGYFEKYLEEIRYSL